jgi:hypothetical protein
MSSRLLVFLLAGTAAIMPWLVYIWGEFGWYALMTAIAVAASSPRSSVSYFARGMLLGCVVYQVVIGTESTNAVSSFVRRVFYHRVDGGLRGFVPVESRLQLAAHLLQFIVGAVSGSLGLWFFQMVEQRNRFDRSSTTDDVVA